MTNNQKLSVEATEFILGNLAESDFVSNAGFNALKELGEYALDIATDIATIFDGRKPNNTEWREMSEAFFDAD